LLVQSINPLQPVVVQILIRRHEHDVECYSHTNLRDLNHDNSVFHVQLDPASQLYEVMPLLTINPQVEMYSSPHWWTSFTIISSSLIHAALSISPETACTNCVDH